MVSLSVANLEPRRTNWWSVNAKTYLREYVLSIHATTF